MRYVTFLVVSICVLLLSVTTAAFAYTKAPTLSSVASVFAQRPVNVRCYAPDEDGSPSSLGAWGYVEQPLAKQHWEALDDRLCAGAVDVNNIALPVWERALGTLVLVHESYHLRRSGTAGNEAATECRAIRHWKVGARMLGASEATIDEIWPFALTSHYILTFYVDIVTNTRPYFDPHCVVPDLWTPPNPVLVS